MAAQAPWPSLLSHSEIHVHFLVIQLFARIFEPVLSLCFTNKV